MKESIEQQIIDYAKSTEPHECCGFILRDHMAGGGGAFFSLKRSVLLPLPKRGNRSAQFL